MTRQAVKQQPLPTQGKPAVRQELEQPTSQNVQDIRCPNCGHNKFDEDGDCEACKEPNVVPTSREPQEETIVRHRKTGQQLSKEIEKKVRGIIKKHSPTVEEVVDILQGLINTLRVE